MEIVLIRHGKTEGNRGGRYVGRTDESLCEEGNAEIHLRKEAGLYKEADAVYVSPMKRCIETAGILYPDQNQKIVQDFRECDFGAFEYKNYRELKDDVRYIKWMESGGKLSFPEGEPKAGFTGRCSRALNKILEAESGLCTDKERNGRSIACIIHGGTIMAVMESMERSGKGFYEYQTENGGGFSCDAYRGQNTFILRLRSRI